MLREYCIKLKIVSKKPLQVERACIRGSEEILFEILDLSTSDPPASFNQSRPMRQSCLAGGFHGLYYRHVILTYENPIQNLLNGLIITMTMGCS